MFFRVFDNNVREFLFETTRKWVRKFLGNRIVTFSFYIYSKTIKDK